MDFLPEIVPALVWACLLSLTVGVFAELEARRQVTLAKYRFVPAIKAARQLPVLALLLGVVCFALQAYENPLPAALAMAVAQVTAMAMAHSLSVRRRSVRYVLLKVHAGAMFAAIAFLLLGQTVARSFDGASMQDLLMPGLTILAAFVCTVLPDVTLELRDDQEFIHLFA